MPTRSNQSMWRAPLQSLVLCSLLMHSPLSDAAVSINLTEAGGDVVASASGTVNTAGLPTPGATNAYGGYVQGSESSANIKGEILVGGSDAYLEAYDISTTVAFSTGKFLYASTSSGSYVGLYSTDTVDLLLLPSGYVSGDTLSSTSTWSSVTFADLGLIPGSYIVTWGSGATADSLALNIGPIVMNDQTITIFSATPPGGAVGESSTLSATASSGLTIVFASNTPTICTVAGAIVSYLADGICTVTADQAGSANFNPAPQATLAIGVGLTDQISGLGFMKWSYLKASNTQSRQRFGWAVAMDGNTLAVSAIGEGSASTGVNGDQYLFGGARSGAVYVFTFDAGVWSQQAYVKASNTGLEDRFGYSIALSGDTLAVGATRERSGTGVQDDNSAGSSGAVYVFTRNAGVWSQQAYLKASNIGAFDEFGWSVDLDGDTLVVGAHQEDGSASGVNEPSDENAANSGAAYVFLRSGETWSQQAYLKASNTDKDDKFGHSVAISGDTLVVGSEWESSSAIGVSGNQDDNSALAAGAAYVFTRSGATWTQQAYLKASNTDPYDKFGGSVAIEADTLLVGAAYEDSNGTDESNNQFGSSGAAYVFSRNGEVWLQQVYLKASNVQGSDRFGYKVAISGDMALVSAFGESSNATGVDGNQLDNSIPNAGAVYVFSRGDALWRQKSYLKQFPSGQGQDGFGDSLAIYGDTVLVGANSENSNATGVDGDQINILAIEAGAAYLFKADVLFRDSLE